MSKTIAELREDFAFKARCAKDVTEKARGQDRPLAAAEVSEVDALLKDCESLKLQVEQQELSEHKENQVRQMLELASSRRITTPDQPNDLSDPDAEWEKNILRYGQLHAFKGPAAEKNAFIAGQWVLAQIFRKDSAIRWCKRNGMHHFAQSEGVSSAGGILVPKPLAQAIIDLREQYGVFRRFCDLIPMSSDGLIMPRAVGGLDAVFTAENTAVTEDEQVWDNVELNAQKLGVLVRMSTELAEDAVVNIADWLARKMAEAFAKKEDQVGFSGAGTAADGNILGVTTKIEANVLLQGFVLATATHDTFAEVDAGDLSRVMAKLPEFAGANARWYCSRTAFELVFSRLAVGGGGNTIDMFSGAVQRAYLGYPIVISQILPSSTGTITDNKVMLLFGDLSQAATMGERRGFTIKTSEDRYFELDQLAIKATERIDINVHDIGDTVNAGPIVALISNLA